MNWERNEWEKMKTEKKKKENKERETVKVTENVTVNETEIERGEERG